MFMRNLLSLKSLEVKVGEKALVSSCGSDGACIQKGERCLGFCFVFYKELETLQVPGIDA